MDSVEQVNGPVGLLKPELFIGVTSAVSAQTLTVNLVEAHRSSGLHFKGARYGRGEVGEFVLVEGQQSILLGRIAEVRLSEPERRELSRERFGSGPLPAVGSVQLLGCIAPDSLRVTAGVDSYARLGDRLYSAPHEFLAQLPRLMESEASTDSVILHVGQVGGATSGVVSIRPERLFGRHCAILGATGGGKSWTTARLIEQCAQYQSKLILLDATSEYRDLDASGVTHLHLGTPATKAAGSSPATLPPTSFTESDFIALFDPSGKVQGPKLRAAIRSLRLAKLRPALAPKGFIEKINKSKTLVEAAESEPEIARKLDDPRQPFDVTQLVKQIEQECVYPDGYGIERGKKDYTKWGGEDGNFSHCLSLVARINGVLTSPAFVSLFNPANGQPITDAIDAFLASDGRVLRICLGGVAYEYSAREIVANAIGRHLLGIARRNAFAENPAVVFVDEAHNFLGRRVGLEDNFSRLDSFELIAKEGRKYGLTVCLASQRPRDITEGVLSQMGTLIVHRLTNDRDREVVERACGAIDRAASAFLPNLLPGEASIIGTDFPIPLTVQVAEPNSKPVSQGPQYQRHWSTPLHEVD